MLGIPVTSTSVCTVRNMLDLLGLDAATLEDVCRKATGKGVVCPANYNSPGQTVISGDLVALSEAIELAIAQGARRVVSRTGRGARLPVPPRVRRTAA